MMNTFDIKEYLPKLRFNRHAKKELYFNIFLDYYFNPEKYKNSYKNLTKQRRLQYREKIYEKLYETLDKQIFDTILNIVKEKEFIVKSELVKELKNILNNTDNINLLILVDTFLYKHKNEDIYLRRSIYSKEPLIIYSEKNYKIFKKIIDNIIKYKKKHKTAISLKALKSALIKIFKDENIVDKYVNVICSYTKLICFRDTLVLGRQKANIEKVKALLRQYKKEGRKYFYTKEIKSELNMNTALAVRILNHLQSEGYIKRIRKGKYKFN